MDGIFLGDKANTAKAKVFSFSWYHLLPGVESQFVFYALRLFPITKRQNYLVQKDRIFSVFYMVSTITLHGSQSGLVTGSPVYNLSQAPEVYSVFTQILIASVQTLLEQLDCERDRVHPIPASCASRPVYPMSCLPPEEVRGKSKSDVFIHDHSRIELLSLKPRRVPRAEMVAFGFAFFLCLCLKSSQFSGCSKNVK